MTSLPPLDPEHEKWLVTESAISREIIERSGVYSLYDPKEAVKLLGRKVEDWFKRIPVLIFPYRIPFHRDPVLVRGRPLIPFERAKTDGSVSLAKYVQAKGTGTHLYFGPSLLEGKAIQDPTVPLWITEGERKCLSAESHGLSCIAIPGVSQWHEKGEKLLHKHFSYVQLREREVFICFDEDALRNKDVRREELALGRALEAVGATVRVVRLPKDAPKLDDFFARHDSKELAKLIEDARQHGALPPDTSASTSAPPPGTGCTDLANAERFVRMHGADVRYCEQIGKWYFWDSRCWVIDETRQVVRRAMRTVRAIYGEAAAITDPDERVTIRKWAMKSESSERLSAIVRLASSFKNLAVSLSDFDSDPWLLNVQNGLLDLRTGELRAHDRGAMCTRVAPTFYDPNAKDKRWTSFLEHVANGEPEIEGFLKRSVGYSLTGDTREDKFFCVSGLGGRGKSTFMLAIESILGDYAKTASIETFMATPNGGGDKPRPDLVRLAGARIVVCKEIEAGARLNEGLVKTFTGGDTVTVRALHKEPFEFRPTSKLWLIFNDPPVVRGDDSGMWRRIVRVPFDRGFERPDKSFREAFKADVALKSAVLAWAAEGVRAWLQLGLAVPDAVANSTSEYRAEMDPTGEWLDRFVVFEKDARISRKELRRAYEEWCKDEGHLAVGARRFASVLRERATQKGIKGHSLGTSVRRDEKVVDGWLHVRLATNLELETVKRWGARVAVLDGDRGAFGSEGCRDVGAVGTFSQFRAPVNSGDRDRAVGSNEDFDFPDSSNQVPTVPTVPTNTVTTQNSSQKSVGTFVGTLENVGTSEEQNPGTDNLSEDPEVEWTD